jgi:ligand-binding sensor domain-containing protein
MVTNCALATSLLTSPYPLEPPSTHLMFKQVYSEVGKTSIELRRLFQDSKGYLWVGTSEGILRYDGYSFQEFFRFNNSNHPRHLAYIYDIKEDSLGQIWIATNDGLKKLNPIDHLVTDLYTSLAQETQFSTNKYSSLKYNYIAVLFPENNRILAGTNHGLDEIDIATNKVTPLVRGYYVSQILKDPEGYFWLGSVENGLLRYNESTKEIKRYSISNGADNAHSIIFDIVKYKQYLWIATDEGLRKFNTHTKSIVSSQLSNIVAKDLEIDSHNRLWIGSPALYYYILDKDELNQVKADPADRRSLSSNDTVALTVSQQNNSLWIGTAMGISLLDLAHPTYMLRKEFPGKRILGSNLAEHKLNVATSLGVSVFDYNTNIVKNYDNTGEIYRAVIDKQNVWLAGEQGAFTLDQESDTLVNVTPKLVALSNKVKKHIYDILVLNDQQFFASHYGLIILDRYSEQQTLLTINKKNRDKWELIIRSLHKYQSLIIAASATELFYVNFKENELSPYLLKEQDYNFDRLYISDITSDDTGNLWVSTTNGLFKIKDRKIIEHYRETNGLPTPHINRVSIM